jgi:hypothetical protein
LGVAENGGDMMGLREEAILRKEVYRFWFHNYRRVKDHRRQVFVDALLIRLRRELQSEYYLTAELIPHPEKARKDFYHNHSVLEILADFLLRANQVEERSEDHPIYNPEKEFNDRESRKKVERSMISGDNHSMMSGDKHDYGKDDSWPSGERQPYSIDEYEFNNEGKPVEEQLFAESQAETVDEFR